MATDRETITQAVANAVETVAATAQDAVASAENAIASAEARAEAADALNEELTDAALRGKLGERLTELEDECDQWQSAVENQQTELSSLTNRCASMEAALSSLQATLQEVKTQLSMLQPSSQVVLTETQTPSGTTVTETTVQPPNNPVVEGALPVQETRRRVRIL